MKKEKKKVKPEISAEVFAELKAEIDTLRTSVTEMVDRYKGKVDGDLALVSELNDQLPPDVADAMLKDIRALDIKAHKGRAKDFQRVQDLIDGLVEQLPAAT